MTPRGGAHTWDSLQDYRDSPYPPFDFPRYVEQLQGWGHNFVRLWSWPGGIRAAGLIRLAASYGPTFSEFGPDFAPIDESYYLRLDKRVGLLQSANISCSVMLENWYTPRTGSIAEYEGAVTSAQLRHIDRVVEIIRAYPLAEIEVGNEIGATGLEWQRRMVQAIKARTTRRVHVNTGFGTGGSTLADLEGLGADIVALPYAARDTDYPAPRRQPALADTDHIGLLLGTRDPAVMVAGLRKLHSLGYDLALMAPVQNPLVGWEGQPWNDRKNPAILAGYEEIGRLVSGRKETPMGDDLASAVYKVYARCVALRGINKRRKKDGKKPLDAGDDKQLAKRAAEMAEEIRKGG
jgi:hypothetical protein